MGLRADRMMMLPVAVACAACTRTRCTTTRRGAHARRRPRRYCRSSTQSIRLRFTARRRCCSPAARRSARAKGKSTTAATTSPKMLGSKAKGGATATAESEGQAREVSFPQRATSSTRRTCAPGSLRSESARLARSWCRRESLSHFELYLPPRWPPTWCPCAYLPLWRCKLAAACSGSTSTSSQRYPISRFPPDAVNAQPVIIALSPRLSRRPRRHTYIHTPLFCPRHLLRYLAIPHLASPFPARHPPSSTRPTS